MSNKVDDSAATSIKGSFVLFVGNTIAMIVNAVGVILVARMLIPSEYGLFTITLVLPSIFGLLAGWGIDDTLTRFIARKRIRAQSINLKNLIYSSYLFRIIIGGILTLFLFFMGDLLSALILQKPEVGSYVRIASVLVISQAIFQTNIAIYAGYENMTVRAALNIFQSLIKGIFSPLFVYIGLGVSGVVVAHTASYAISGIIGLVLVVRQTSLVKESESPQSFIETLVLVLTFGLPLFFSQILVLISAQVRGIFLSWYVSSNIIGNYGVANWFNVLLFTVTNSIGVALFPAFSKYEYKIEPDLLRDIYRGSVRYSTIFIVPLTLIIITSSDSIIKFLFGTKYPYAPLFLSLLLIPNLFIGLGTMSMRRLLISQGETRATLVLDAFSALFTIILAYVFIQIWNVEGLLVSLGISTLASCIFGSYVIDIKFGIRHNITHVFQTSISAGLSGLISFFLVDSVHVAHPFLDLVLKTTVFLTIYILLAPLFGAIQERDGSILDNMFRNISILYPFARIVLVVINKIIQLRKRIKRKFY